MLVYSSSEASTDQYSSTDQCYSIPQQHFLNSLNIPGYKIHEIAEETLNSIIAFGVELSTDRPCILKLLNTDYPSQQAIIRLKHEAEITRELDVDGIIKAYGCVSYRSQNTNHIALILEDFKGQSLASLWEEIQGITIFLDIAIQIVTILGDLQAHHVIHKDIKPHNILYNLETKQIKLTDFGIATQLSSENPIIKNPDFLEGTLPYMSPEQTGRMNRNLDYRTDFYSLGVTFYQLLTGQLPFHGIDDAMEWVHCHIAKSPTPCHEVNPQVPLVLSTIVSKLMAKNAEDRYQSAHGLRMDLLQCQHFVTDFVTDSVMDSGSIPNFELGLHDHSTQLQIPQKLYGREAEITTLMTAFSRTQRGSCEMVLVGGYSGIGKSAIVHEVQRPIAQQRGYFISGKFDQLKRNIPYSAFIQSFQDLIRQILTESPEHVAQWRAELLEVLEDNAQILIDVIPELEFIIGPQSPILPLGPIEAQNRFNLLFVQFVRIFTKTSLVLFLDDMQWADQASLMLLKQLMTDPESRGFLCIVAYRDNEVDRTHPFSLTLDEICASGNTPSTITLQPLTLDHIQQLLVDTLKCSLELTERLGELLLKKTSGNPFFVTQLLNRLYREDLLYFEYQKGKWAWDIEKIRVFPISENIVELVTQTIETLPNTTQKIISLAACIGNRFDLKTLAIISQQSLRLALDHLWDMLKLNLVIPLSSDYKLLSLVQEDELPEIEFRFLHDRVQQAAYVLIPTNQREQIHHHIGHLLLNASTHNEIEENLFDIVNHLNLAINLATTSIERQNLIQLNYQATQKAISASAYAPAINYARAGISLLIDTDWQSNHLRDSAIPCFELYRDRIQCEYIVGHFEIAEELCDQLLQTKHSDQLSDYNRAEINTIRLTHYQNNAHYEKAIEIGLESLRLFGLDLPEHPSVEEIETLFLAVEESIIHPMELLDAPAMTQAKSQMLISLLMNLVPPTYLVNQPLMGLLVLHMMRITLRDGNTLLSVFVYTWYGTILCGNFGNYDRGYTFGQLALKLNEKLGSTLLNGKLYMSLGNFINHWRKPIQENLETQNVAYQFAKATGDFSWCHHSVAFSFWQKFDSFATIEALIETQSKYIGFAEATEPTVGLAIVLQRNILLNLSGKTRDRFSLSTSDWDEETAIQVFQKNSYAYGINTYTFSKMVIFLTYGEYQKAYEMSLEVEKICSAMNAQYQIVLYSFYQALILLALYPGATFSDKSQYLKLTEEHCSKLKIWSENCPENFLAMYQLVLAGMAQIQGDFWVASQQYDEAIENAKCYQLYYLESLANELTARFYYAVDRRNLGDIYLKQAYDRYKSWGATPKLEWLESQFPDCLSRYGHPYISSNKALNSPQISSLEHPTNSTSNLNTLDFDAMMKSCLVLSSQVDLSELLKSLMRIVLENAGAERGVLLFEQQDISSNRKLCWTIELEGIVQGDLSFSLRSSSIPLSQAIPISLLNYVVRTENSVVLDQALVEGQFVQDPYIVQNQCRSILCLPLNHQGKLVSVLYLENNVINHAFTTDRLEVLKVLCSQAAISIEKARLYNSLESRISDRTIELQDKNQQLEKTIQDLHLTQSQMIQTEKMSSLGGLVAGIAHEINNPINFIFGNVKHFSQYTQDLLELVHAYDQAYPEPSPEIQDKREEIDIPFLESDLPRLLKSINNGTIRITSIVQSLRTFSRLDEATCKSVNIHDGIESTLMILGHRLKIKGNGEFNEIVVEKIYGDLPKIDCYAGQMNQVFMNILNNAIYALEEKHKLVKSMGETFGGKITIMTELDRSLEQIKISIIDNGIGIPEEIQERIFDPFFTSKPVGTGSGLGLATSYQIVTERHGGKLYAVPSNHQTEFVILIPMQQGKMGDY
jgi:predicted ATPase/signal transduction histidine kinase